MKKRNLIFVIAAPLAVSGCFESSERISALENKVDAHYRQTSQLQRQLKPTMLTADEALAKDIATNRRLAGITAYLMDSSQLATIDDALKPKIQLIADELKSDTYRDVQYLALEQEGFFNTIKPISQQTKEGFNSYLIQGKWRLDVPAGSAFDLNYPMNAIKALNYERIPNNGSLCYEGSPVIVHALLSDHQHYDPVATQPTVSVQQETSAWRVMINDVNFNAAFQKYRVLVDIRCVLSSEARGDEISEENS